MQMIIFFCFSKTPLEQCNEKLFNRFSIYIFITFMYLAQNTLIAYGKGKTMAQLWRWDFPLLDVYLCNHYCKLGCRDKNIDSKPWHLK